MIFFFFSYKDNIKPERNNKHEIGIKHSEDIKIDKAIIHLSGYRKLNSCRNIHWPKAIYCKTNKRQKYIKRG